MNGNLQKLFEEIFHQKRLLAQAMAILPSSLDSSDDDDKETVAHPSSPDPCDEDLSYCYGSFKMWEVWALVLGVFEFI